MDAVLNVKNAKSRMVANRWTPNLAKDGWTPIADFFLNSYSRLAPKIKAAEAMFIIHLMSFKWDKEAPYPGFKTIASRMGITAEGARLLARSLEKKGYLHRQMQVGSTNKFHLDNLFAALEKLRADDTIENARKAQTEALSVALANRLRRESSGQTKAEQQSVPHSLDENGPTQNDSK